MQDFDIELPELPAEFEADYQRLLEAEMCEPCDGEECEFEPLCKLIRSYAEE